VSLFRRGGLIPRKADVVFGDAVFAPGLGEDLGRPGRFGQDEDARGDAVQSVDSVQTMGVSKPTGSLLVSNEIENTETTRVRVVVVGHTGRLVHDQDLVVLEENGNVHVVVWSPRNL